MKESRRKFMKVSVGTILTGSLAGCMNDNQNNNDTNNTDSNLSNTNTSENNGTEVSNNNSYIKESVTDITCTEDANDLKNIGLNSNDNFNFSGTKRLDSKCYSVDINSQIKDEVLVVNIELYQTEDECIRCSGNTEPQLSYSGIAIVDNNNITESELNIIIN